LSIAAQVEPNIEPIAEETQSAAATGQKTGASVRVALAVLLMTLAGGLFRYLVVTQADFPLNDGGLEFQLTTELIARGFQPPAFTSYNTVNVPFFYPPLGLYIAGAAARLFNLPLLDVMRWYPAIISLPTIPLMYILSRQLLRSKMVALMAALLFALLPPSSLYVMIGSGVASATGFTLALLTLILAYQLFATRQEYYIFLTAIVATLTLLSHLVWGLFVIYSIIWLFVIYGRNGYSFIHALLGTLLAGTFTSIWLGLLVRFYGVTPLLAALRTINLADILTEPSILIQLVLAQPFYAVIGVFTVIGMVIFLIRRRFFLPLWIVVILLLGRDLTASLMTIPTAMLVAAALFEIVSPLLSSAEATQAANRFLFNALVVILLISFFAFAAYNMTTAMQSTSLTVNPARPLPAAERDAMDWIRQNTPPDSRLLLFTSAPSWRRDPIASWFPVLTERFSPVTVHGSIWQDYQAALAFYTAQQTCFDVSPPCLAETVQREAGLSTDPTYVYLSSDITRRLVIGGENSNFRQVYNEGGVAVFAVANVPR
jgi:hypothetical protein